ncbi:MAG: GTPase HflX [Candidatus Izimaplasma sp.]|nr:GTPase HflX [Candidatus Izimaplasma bacterium]
MQKTLLVGANINNDPLFDYLMDELKSLAEARNFVVKKTITQKINSISPTYFIGSGKLNEIKKEIEINDINLVIFNDELSGSQIRNIEEVLDCKTIDRTLLILDIFSKRAKTKEAMLQVEIAQLEYMLPRLVGLDDSFSRQTGGGFKLRGPGEKKLELDRRHIRDEINTLKKELKRVENTRELQRKHRNKSLMKKVAIVGYTNAGKSTLLNGLVNYEKNTKSKNVFVKNMLFATLDTATRQVKIPNKREFLVTDTVGFVSNLPHDLVEAFKSTLEEITDADLIVHVVDASNPYYQEQIDVTNTTLKEIGVHDIPTLYVYNKADLLKTTITPTNYPNSIVSLLDNEDIQDVVALIEEHLFQNYETKTLLIPFDKGDIVSTINSHNTVLEQKYEDGGTKIKATLSPRQLKEYTQYII